MKHGKYVQTSKSLQCRVLFLHILQVMDNLTLGTPEITRRLNQHFREKGKTDPDFVHQTVLRNLKLMVDEGLVIIDPSSREARLKFTRTEKGEEELKKRMRKQVE